MAHAKHKRNAQLQREYEAGDSLVTIAERHGITHERVRQILTRRKVPMRPSGGDMTARRAARQKLMPDFGPVGRTI